MKRSRIIMVVAVLLLSTIAVGCGAKWTYKAPSITSETHTRHTVDLGGLGSANGIGDCEGNPALTGDQPRAPSESTIPPPMYGSRD